MTPRDVARGYGAGRAALGAALLVAPRSLGRIWLGDTGASPAGAVALRALGVRDVVMGMIAVHTAGHPEVGPRWQRACALADGVDLAATLAARRGGALPRAGSLLVAAIAVAGTATGVATGAALARNRAV